MALPGGVSTLTLTGKYEDLQGNPQSGTVTFTPSTGPFADPAVTVIFEPAPVVATLDNTGAISEVLACTDNSGFEPNSWVWNVTERVSGFTVRSYSIALPSTLGPSVDLSTLAQVEPTSDYDGYLLLSAGESQALGGTLWLNGSPPIALPSGTAGYVLTSDDGGNITLQAGGGRRRRLQQRPGRAGEHLRRRNPERHDRRRVLGDPDRERHVHVLRRGERLGIVADRCTCRRTRPAATRPPGPGRFRGSAAARPR